MSDTGRRPETDVGEHPTTTHSAWGAGRPRLIVSRGDERQEFELPDEVRIGSAADAELRLDDTLPLHAEIHHEAQDEYVLVFRGPGESTTEPMPLRPLSDEPGLVLRTGARFTIGPWTLVFQRDEFADHGRPYGGREGGESDVQRPQPPRPDYGSVDPMRGTGPDGMPIDNPSG